MKIDLTNIFNLQKELDKHIETQHNLKPENVWVERKLALIVELAETANEIRSFKFWSLKAPSDKPIILEEYADGIHFITSLCCFFKVDPIFEVSELNKFNSKREITDAFLKLFVDAATIKDASTAKAWFVSYLQFGLAMGFSIDEITSAYEAKCKINHQRQENKY